LDLARRDVGVDGLGRAPDDLTLRLEHELVADVVCDLRRVLRVLRVDDELHLSRVVAEIDEDEAAEVAPRIHPACERHALARVGGGQHTARGVTPAAHSSAGSSSCTVRSSSPRFRTSNPSLRTTTIVVAPRFCAWVSWPLSERPP